MWYNKKFLLYIQLQTLPTAILYVGKHDPDIISERRSCAEAFLDFSLKHKILAHVIVFIDFLKVCFFG